jgi:hypothetical protein
VNCVQTLKAIPAVAADTAQFKLINGIGVANSSVAISFENPDVDGRFAHVGVGDFGPIEGWDSSMMQSGVDGDKRWGANNNTRWLSQTTASMTATQYYTMAPGNWTGTLVLDSKEGRVTTTISAAILGNTAYTAVLHLGVDGLPEMLLTEDTFKSDKETPALKSWIKVRCVTSSAC